MLSLKLFILGRCASIHRRVVLCCAGILLLAGCATDPTSKQGEGAIVCDNYLILQMCVRDLVGDGIVDMIYFSDTDEIFMYREGMKEVVAPIMPFHRCVVPLSEEMQATTNRILNRANLTVSEELSLMKELLSSYLAAKPEIDACHARFDAELENRDDAQDDFFIEEPAW